MASADRTKRRSTRKSIVALHRWLGVGAAIFWLVQAVTGLFMSFHFEIDDALMSGKHRPTDLAAIERRLDSFADAGGKSKVHYIWTSAGLPDRYVINYSAADGDVRNAYINGAGEVLEDRSATQLSFLKLMRAIHIDLMLGAAGHWIMAITGTLLVTNLIFGLVISWPKKGWWKVALKPVNRGATAARAYSWHRALGLWAGIPAIVIAASGTLILLEPQVRDLVGAPETELPTIPLRGEPVGFAEAVAAGTKAVPGSKFIGTTLPGAANAGMFMTVHLPGEPHRGGYGGSNVIIDGNDATILGAYPITEGSTAAQFVNLLYPVHTGEIMGTVGRILGWLIALWLATMVVLGLILWQKRRPRKKGGLAAKG